MLMTKTGLEKTLVGFGRWRWVHKRICACGHTVRILGNDTKRSPGLPTGGMRCPLCEKIILF